MKKQYPVTSLFRPSPLLPEMPAGTLQEWNGSFTYNGTNYPYVMVGQDPATSQGSVITT